MNDIDTSTPKWRFVQLLVFEKIDEFYPRLSAGEDCLTQFRTEIDKFLNMIGHELADVEVLSNGKLDIRFRRKANSR